MAVEKLLKNKHSPKQNYEFMNWLSANRDWIEKSTMTYEEIRLAAEEALKFRVTERHVRGRMKDLGMKCPLTRGGTLATKEQMALVQEELARLRAKVEAMEVRLASLEISLGVRKLEHGPPKM